MGIGVLRNILRPLTRAVHARSHVRFPAVTSSNSPLPITEFRFVFGSILLQSPWISRSQDFHSLTDTRYPKRRPSDKSRRKRASIKPPDAGPYAWVKELPGEPVISERPNEGSVKGRNRKKRIAQRKAFIKAEAKKRKAQLQEAKRKKNIKKIERKMAAVARERAWSQRLLELQQLEEEKSKSAV